MPGIKHKQGVAAAMKEGAWVKELPASITVCDTSGTVLEMNDRSRQTFASDGGGALIGTNLLDCHTGPSRERLADLLATGSTNCYTIEKAGIKKLIFQTPWFAEGKYRGLVEISIQIPEQMPHFIRG